MLTSRQARRIIYRQKVSVALLFVFGTSALFFVSFYLPVDDTWFGNIRNMAANVVGVSAAVPPNQYNTLAQQLEEKRQKLDVREKAIKEREASLSAESEDDLSRNGIIPYGVATSSLLFLLTSVNLYFARRVKKGSVKRILNLREE